MIIIHLVNICINFMTISHHSKIILKEILIDYKWKNNVNQKMLHQENLKNNVIKKILILECQKICLILDFLIKNRF